MKFKHCLYTFRTQLTTKVSIINYNNTYSIYGTILSDIAESQGIFFLVNKEMYI